jgi:hypothetical protein
VTLVIQYPFFVRYVCKLDSWAHILYAFGLAIKPGVIALLGARLLLATKVGVSPIPYKGRRALE